MMFGMASAFAETLEKLIERRGITRYRVAADAGISQGHMTNMALGKRSPTPDVMERLSAVFSPEEVAELQAARARDLLEREGLSRALPAEIAGKLKKASEIGGAPTIEKRPEGLKPEPLPPMGKLVRIPVYEDVKCGWNGVVTEHPVEWEEWPEWMTGGGDHAIRARGGSMRDVGIEDGTLVFVKRFTGQAKKIPSGKKVIAHLGDDHYTCKVLVHDRHVSWLQGAADGYLKPIYLHQEPKPRIVGVVTGYHRIES